jgi:hypothetical protein
MLVLATQRHEQAQSQQVSVHYFCDRSADSAALDPGAALYHGTAQSKSTEGESKIKAMLH